MTYSLDFDIPDGKGGILYPKGYQFNPLDYVPFNQTLVVIDGEDPDQVDWLKASPLVKRPDTLILLTGGAFSEIGQGLGRAVFYATRQIVKRFQLKAVPSVIRRDGRMMEVEEIEIPEK
jgi:conjugal transfer pilus assembly protein TraW